MKTTHRIRTVFLSSLAFALLTIACSRDVELEATAAGPLPQLSSNCGALSGGPLYMRDWAPAIATELNTTHAESPSGTSTCTATGNTTPASDVLCWSGSTLYDGAQAGDNVCTLMEWARSNRPTASAGPNLTLNRWLATGFGYAHDPGAPCEPGSQVPDPDPLKLDVTYTEYNCDVNIVYDPNEIEYVAFSILSAPTDPQQPGDGEVQMSMRPIKEVSDGDDESDGGDDSRENIKGIVTNDSGMIVDQWESYQSATDPDIEMVEFEVQGYSLADLTITLEVVEQPDPGP